LSPTHSSNGRAEDADGSSRSGRRLVLAIDTALGACSAAVVDTNLNASLAVQSVEMERGHAEALVPMIAQVMQSAGVEFEELERIATTIGPGSFTGLRVGIAAARGIALAAGKPVVGVSTLDALTAPFSTESETVPIVAALDARHGNFYLQMVGAGGRKLVSPRVVNVEQALQSCAIGLVRIIGSGANLLASRWPVPNVPAPILVDPRSAPDIVWVARLGGKADPEKSRPKPMYLKAPDAQPQEAYRLPRQ
jgi:tRNA threonylcarbamoyladenosine biosynthesis protein TsaB